MSASDSQLVNLLAKKYAQLPDTNPDVVAASEKKISSKPAVLSSQIYSQNIPSDDATINSISSSLLSTLTNPKDTNGVDIDFTNNGQHIVTKTLGNVNISTRLVTNTSINGNDYSYIVKYEFIKLIIQVAN